MNKMHLILGALVAAAVGGYFLLKEYTVYAVKVIRASDIGLVPGESGNPIYMDWVGGGNGDNPEDALGPPDGKFAVLGVSSGELVLDFGKEYSNVSKVSMLLGNARDVYPAADQIPVTNPLGVQVSVDSRIWQDTNYDDTPIPIGGGVKSATVSGPVRYVRVYQRVLHSVRVPVDYVALTYKII